MKNVTFSTNFHVWSILPNFNWRDYYFSVAWLCFTLRCETASLGFKREVLSSGEVQAPLLPAVYLSGCYVLEDSGYGLNIILIFAEDFVLFETLIGIILRIGPLMVSVGIDNGAPNIVLTSRVEEAIDEDPNSSEE